jgi:hypothetical protein
MDNNTRKNITFDGGTTTFDGGKTTFQPLTVAGHDVPVQLTADNFYIWAGYARSAQANLRTNPDRAFSDLEAIATEFEKYFALAMKHRDGVDAHIRDVWRPDHK